MCSFYPEFRSKGIWINEIPIPVKYVINWYIVQRLLERQGICISL